MNKIYQLVWNSSKGLLQIASEKSASRGKGKRSQKKLRLSTTGMLLLCSPAAFSASVLPTGGTLVAGSGSIAAHDQSLTVTQSSQRMAIDWQSFSIGSGNSVSFVQPSATAVALNRVTGADPSVIQGALKANGQVFLLNPNGVLFSPTAQVNAGALVASTLNLKLEDFLAGRYAFDGSSSNAVINQGNIQAIQGGSVALIAAKVSNTGDLQAKAGNVLLGAGSKVLLDLGGPVKLQIDQGALNALIENGGAVRADGGTVLMHAKAAGELVSTVINNSGLVQAQTLATGEKGTILLLGDMQHGHIEVGGTLDAQAKTQGDGGFIETSAASVNTANGLKVNAGAAQGKGGLWLVDPYDYTINTAAAANITGALNNGTSVTVTTQSNTGSYGSTGSGNGDITVSSAITKSAGGDATLTLRADRNIFVNSDITATSGKLNLTLSAANATGATLGGVDINGHLKSNGGDILIGGALGAANHGIGYATNLNSSSGAIVIEQNKSVLSTGGSIVINGKSTIGSNSGNYSGVTAGVYVKSGASIVSGNGNLFLTGESAGGIKTFGLGFEGNSGTVTTLGTSPGAGNMVINGVNSTSGYAASTLDQGAVGMVSYGNRDRIVFQGPSVASWLVFVNGAAQLSAYTQSPQLSSCSASYPNCGTMVVPGSNNSYLYATYQAVSMSTNPLYVIQSGSGSKVYDGTTSTSGLSYSVLGGPIGFTVNSLSPRPLYTTASKNVGTYTTLIANAANPGSYISGGTSYAVGYFNTGSYSITPKALTPIASDKVYDGNTTAAVTATGLISGDNVTLSGTGTFASRNAGTYNNVGITGINLTGSDAGNYTLSGSSVSNATASILPRTVSLSASKIYDGSASFSSAVSIGNLVNGEELQYTSAAANSAHAGTASYLSALTLANGSNGLATNYQLPAMNAAGSSNTAVITPKALTATLANSSVSKVYDGTTTAPSGFTPSWNVSGLVSGDTAASISGNAAFDNAHVVSASKVTVSGMTLGAITGSNGSLASDYALDASSKFVTASITPKTLATALANNSVSKVYDGSTTAPAGFSPDWNVSGFVSGDTAANISGSAAYDSSHVGLASKVMVSGMALGSITGTNGSQVSDYALDASSKFVNASITARTLTASLTNQTVNKVYDGTTDAPNGFTPGWTVSGLASGDTSASVTHSTAAYDSQHAGSATRVTVSGIAINGVTGSLGSQAGDYVLDATSKFATASITPKALTANLINSNVSKVYDGTTTAPAGFTPDWSVSGLVNGDTTAAISGNAAYDNAHVASASKVTVVGMTLGAITGSNNSQTSDYALDATSKFISASITPKTVSATLTNGNVTKTFDGSSSAPRGFVPGWNVTGLLADDGGLNLTYTSAGFHSSQTGAATRLSVSGISISGVRNSRNGSQVSDYALAVSTADTPGSIVAAPATPTPPATPAVSPTQYVALPVVLAPPATGELTYVPASDRSARPVVSTTAGTTTGTAPATSQNTAPEASADTVPAPSGSSLTVIKRQRKVASQASQAVMSGTDIKALDVLVISDGIRMPAAANN